MKDKRSYRQLFSYLRFQWQATVEENERDGNIRYGDLWL